MSTTRLVCALCACAFAWAAPTLADDKQEEVALQGYSRAAEKVVARTIKAVQRLASYSDEAYIRMETSAMVNMPKQTSTFLYKKPNRFRIKTMANEVVSDGKVLTVYVASTRRYKTEPLSDDPGKQVAKFFGGMGMKFGAAELILAKDPRTYFAKNLIDLDVAGDDRIDGDRCTLLEGMMKADMMGMPDRQIPVTIWLRDKDGMIRRVELDLAEMMKEQFEDNPAVLAQFSEYKAIYEVAELKVNERIDDDEFEFEAPSSAKKVDKLYSQWRHTGDTAEQFELSGKQAPAIELDTTDGDAFDLASLEGRIVVLNFLPGGFGMPQATGFDRLASIQRDYADKNVAIVCIHPAGDADKLLERAGDDAQELVILLDPDRSAVTDYFDEQRGIGLVLVGTDGVVQGRFVGMISENTEKALRSELDKLAAGKKLESAKPMTEEQVEEAAEQRSAGFSMGGADPLNEDDLKEAWSVRTKSGQSFSFGGGGSRGGGDELWIRDRDKVKRIDYDGEITAELTIPDPATDQFSQEQFAIGRIGGRLGVVYMKSIPGEDTGQGWRPPKGFVITASDESGRELWRFEQDIESNQIPQLLTVGNIDGRGDDEVLFIQQSTLYVLDARGEEIVRRLLTGWPRWMVIEDRDGDGRDEIYVRTQNKLHRFDYRPQR